MNAPFRTPYEQHVVDPVANRDQWLKLRSQDITASVAGALLGVHEYQTPYGLWALKTGVVTDDIEESGPLLRGRLLEPVALQLLARERPTWRIEQPGIYIRDPIARFGCTPDAFAFDPERSGFGIVQVKTVEPSIFRKKWRADDGLAEPPLWIVVQALVEAELTGASWACVVAMTVGFGIDLHVVEIPLHEGVLAKLREAVTDFWRCVEAGEQPSPDYTRDGGLLARIYGQDDGSTIDLTGDNMLPSLAVEDEQLAGEIKVRKSRREAIKAEVLDKLGAASVATWDGRVIATAKTINRKEYTAKASSYRDVRLKGAT